MKVYTDIEQFANVEDQHVLNLYAEFVKYKTMWLLRGFEKEMQAEGG